MSQVKEREKAPGSVGQEMKDPAVELATELYKNLSMGTDTILHLLPKVKSNDIKTDMTAAMCFYEKTSGQVKQFLTSHGAEAKEESWMTRMSARMGITMNTAVDGTASHIAQMLIEGSTMAVTEMTRLAHQFQNEQGCAELVSLANEIVTFEQGQIEHLKKYL